MFNLNQVTVMELTNTNMVTMYNILEVAIQFNIDMNTITKNKRVSLFLILHSVFKFQLKNVYNMGNNPPM